jgi:hypothetical protein
MTNYSEASYGKQVLAGLVDAALSLSLVTTLMITGVPEVFYQYLEHINSSLLTLIVFGFYRLVSLLLFHQTLGMKLCRVILLNGEEQPLTNGEKLLAAFFILYKGTSYYQTK